MNEAGEKIRVGARNKTPDEATIQLDNMGIKVTGSALYNWHKERVMPVESQYDNLFLAAKKVIDAYGKIVQWHVCVQRIQL